MLARMLGAIRMNVDTYEDVEDDRSATWQALAVVVIVALCLGIGSLLAALMSGEEETGNILGLVFGLLCCWWAPGQYGRWSHGLLEAFS